MKINRIIVFFILTLLIITQNNNINAESDDNITDWNNTSPSIIHKKLWEGKVKSLFDKTIDRKLPADKLSPTSQNSFDISFYDIAMRMNDTTEIIYGDIGIHASATENSVSSVEIDFYYNMTIDSIISAIYGSLSYTRNGNVVTVNLGNTYNIGDDFAFDFYYHGHPIEGGFQAFAFDTYSGRKIMASLSEKVSKAKA